MSMKHYPRPDPATPNGGAGSFTMKTPKKLEEEPTGLVGSGTSSGVWILASEERPPVGPQQPNYPWDSTEAVLTRTAAGEEAWGVLRSCPEDQWPAYWECVDPKTGRIDSAEVIWWRRVR